MSPQHFTYEMRRLLVIHGNWWKGLINIFSKCCFCTAISYATFVYILNDVFFSSEQKKNRIKATDQSVQCFIH